MPNTNQFNTVLWNSGGPGGIGSITLVSDLLYAALRIAGVLNGPGRTPSPEQLADAFNQLNRMLGSWNTDRLIIPSLRIDQYPLDGRQNYTIGPGGDFDVPRPQRIEQAVLAGSRRPLDLLNEQEWVEGRGGLYNDRAYPLSTLYLQPAPESGSSLALYTWQMLAGFTDPNDQVVLPPGYEEAIVYSLAQRIASMFRTKLTPEAADIVIRSKAAIESFNCPSPVMRCDAAILPPRGGSFTRGTE